MTSQRCLSQQISTTLERQEYYMYSTMTCVVRLVEEDDVCCEVGGGDDVCVHVHACVCAGWR